MKTVETREDNSIYSLKFPKEIRRDVKFCPNLTPVTTICLDANVFCYCRCGPGLFCFDDSKSQPL